MPHGFDESETASQLKVVQSYATDLELEVQRLREQAQFVRREAAEAVKRILAVSQQSDRQTAQQNEIEQVASHLRDVLCELRDLPGYHPAHDQVIAIAVRPVVTQVFRWQRLLQGKPDVVLRLEVKAEHVDWFPGRFRQILNHLMYSALKNSHSEQGESRITLAVCQSGDAYELRVADNGKGRFRMLKEAEAQASCRIGPQLTFQAGLPAVMLLVEQSGGTVTVQEGKHGVDLVVVLPRFGQEDFLEDSVEASIVQLHEREAHG